MLDVRDCGGCNQNLRSPITEDGGGEALLVHSCGGCENLGSYSLDQEAPAGVLLARSCGGCTQTNDFQMDPRTGAMVLPVFCGNGGCTQTDSFPLGSDTGASMLQVTCGGGCPSQERMELGVDPNPMLLQVHHCGTYQPPSCGNAAFSAPLVDGIAVLPVNACETDPPQEPGPAMVYLGAPLAPSITI